MRCAGPCGAPARLYPAGRRCPAHSPAALAGRSEHPGESSSPVRTHPSPAAGCRYCGAVTLTSDEHEPVHSCCRAWRAVIAAGFPCPACQVARVIERQPKTWPDGTIRQARLPAVVPLPAAFVPDLSDFKQEKAATEG